MANNAVSDTGPIIHLSEIDAIQSFKVFSRTLIPPEVNSEIKKHKIDLPKWIKIEKLEPKSKDTANILMNQYELDLGEAEAISLAIQERTGCFLTDDLDARIIAKEFKLDVHGSVGIILRAFREKIFSKEEAIKKSQELHTKSSLYITKSLIDEVIKAINEFPRK
jgi:predicted nucleic acid-binding protein